MRSPITLPALALAALLSLGSLATRQQAAYATPVDDTSSQSAQPATDAWITTKVKAELASTSGVDSTDISVTTRNGVVTLTGVLADDVAVKKAIAAAQSVKGARQVDASGLKAKD